MTAAERCTCDDETDGDCQIHGCMPAEIAAEPIALRWLKPDAFHIRTDCGRYTVARVDMGTRDDYVAWRLPRAANELPRELDASAVAKTAREEERLAAIRAMQSRCVEHAAKGAD